MHWGHEIGGLDVRDRGERTDLGDLVGQIEAFFRESDLTA